MAATWAYIARTKAATKRHPEGCVVAVSVDVPEMEKHNAAEIAKWMCSGCTIERVPVEWVREHFGTTTPYQPA